MSDHFWSCYVYACARACVRAYVVSVCACVTFFKTYFFVYEQRRVNQNRIKAEIIREVQNLVFSDVSAIIFKNSTFFIIESKPKSISIIWRHLRNTANRCFLRACFFFLNISKKEALTAEVLIYIVKRFGLKWEWYRPLRRQIDITQQLWEREVSELDSHIHS